MLHCVVFVKCTCDHSLFALVTNSLLVMHKCTDSSNAHDIVKCQRASYLFSLIYINDIVIYSVIQITPYPILSSICTTGHSGSRVDTSTDSEVPRCWDCSAQQECIRTSEGINAQLQSQLSITCNRRWFCRAFIQW